MGFLLIFCFLFSALGQGCAMNGRNQHQPPSFDEFQKEFPFDENNPAHAQTWISWNGNYFHIDGYQATTGEIALSRKWLQNINLIELLNNFSRDKIQVGNTLKVNSEEFKVIGIDPWHREDFKRVIHLSKVIDLKIPFGSQKSLAIKLADVTHWLEHVPRVQRLGNQVKLVDDSPQLVSYPLGAPQNSPYYDLTEKLKLPLEHKITVEFFEEKPQVIFLKDYPKEREKHLFKVSAYDDSTPPKLLAYFERLKSPKGGHGKLFNLTPIDSHVYHFELGLTPAVHELTVYAPKSASNEQDSRDLIKIQKLLGEIPVALMKSIDVIRFDPGGLKSLGFAGSTQMKVTSFYQLTGKVYSKDSIVANILARPDVQETLWHELGHHLELEATTRVPNFNWTLWEDAIASDQKWATPYASTLTSEDFAETLSLYIKTDGGYLNPAVRHNFRHRFDLLDRLLQ